MESRTSIILTIALFFLALFKGIEVNAQLKNIEVEPFDRVVISPHIKVILQESGTESVRLENHGVDENRINVKVEGKTLSIYLDQAKVYTRSYKTIENGRKKKYPLYQGTLVTAYISYKDLNNLELRGEESASCESPITADNFIVKLFGESKLALTSVEAERLRVYMYGENELEIKSGSTNRQKISTYGENKVKAPGLNSRTTKINSFGENKFDLNVVDNLRVTALGESDIHYTGEANLNKGIVIGENKIYQNSY